MEYLLLRFLRAEKGCTPAHDCNARCPHGPEIDPSLLAEKSKTVF